MAGLSKKQLEIKNQSLLDCIKTAICLLDDQTADRLEKCAYAAGVLSVAEERANRNVEMDEFRPIEKWKIRYADGSVGYELFKKEYAVEFAEKKKDKYGGSYTIEEMKKDPQSCNSEGSKK